MVGVCLLNIRLLVNSICLFMCSMRLLLVWLDSFIYFSVWWLMVLWLGVVLVLGGSVCVLVIYLL